MNAINHDISALSIATALGGVAISNVVAFAPRPATATESALEGWIESGAETTETIAEEQDAPCTKGGGNALVDRAALSRALDIISNVIEKRNTVPILSNVCITAHGGNLLVSGTDLDVEIAVAFPAAADSYFGVTLPAHTLKDLLKKATASDFVDVTAHLDGPATVDFERVNYRLQALPVADYPGMRSVKPSHSFTIAGADLVEAFGGVAMAISTEETRYYLNGVYLHYVEPRAIDAYHGDHGALRMVATDGHRLCRQDLAAAEGCKGMPGVIVPRKTVALVQKLLKGKACPDTVQVELSDTMVRLRFDGVTITSKLVDGTFPDYQRVIPTGNDKPATFKAADLDEGIRAVSLISSERGRTVKLTFSDGKCQLAVNNLDQGSAVADIATDYASEGLEIGFNAKYLQEFIATAGGDDFTLMLADSGSPTVLTSSGRKNWLGVIMPMRV